MQHSPCILYQLFQFAYDLLTQYQLSWESGFPTIAIQIFLTSMSVTTKVWFGESHKSRDNSVSQRSVSVTGASAGFGRTVTEHALQQGDKVVATLRKPEALSSLLSKYPSRLLVLPLDVRDPEQIRAAFENALERFGHVDIVFNNAGICIISEAEGMSDGHGRELFEVLFWGAANVTKEAVKVFRERNNPPGGRLLQISSRTTLKVVAGVAHYAAAYVVTR